MFFQKSLRVGAQGKRHDMPTMAIRPSPPRAGGTGAPAPSVSIRSTRLAAKAESAHYKRADALRASVFAGLYPQLLKLS